MLRDETKIANDFRNELIGEVESMLIVLKRRENAAYTEEAQVEIDFAMEQLHYLCSLLHAVDFNQPCD